MNTVKSNRCYKCDETFNSNVLNVLYGYTVCDSCKKNLWLFHDTTIKKHVAAYNNAKKEDSTHLSYEEDVQQRLDFIEKDYISKKIKLLHIQERLDELL